ncbi:MAG TPA: thioredoxin domain-containing protein [Gemmatales bacterium]|nr:thioredoxin domain-containing protein [Gemmatales bacterium]HMP61099.1 thioredoxin domain-containing protein [Gemmatales bacterium]
MSNHATNRLAGEASPYLRQHASNPVDWYPWGPEALTRAREEQKPIFLSIGYAACHWCHVMERESFEDPDVAALLNAHFVPIKVDREERPDIDQIYMTATVALTRHGGWPMSVFLTPTLEPFYAGTYFPPVDRHGLPSFRRVLEGVSQAWTGRREEVLQGAAQLTEHLRASEHFEPAADTLPADLLPQAGAGLARAFDLTHGGFGNAPKFPHPLELRLLLRLDHRSPNADLRGMVTLSLDRMAAGGLYDQLGGGFARYSTDGRWLVPHFEKMLYDNALLVQTYLDGWLVTGTPRYREVIAETIGWVEREMTSPEGAFFSSLDADSEGEEGKFYVWSRDEVAAVLGSEAYLFSDVYDVTASGNWEGHNILHRPKTLAQDARLHGLEEADLEARLAACRQRLLARRGERVRPGLDDKVLTAWNALMISALAQAGAVCDQRWINQAARAADFVLGTLRREDGRLLRSYHPKSGPRLLGYLEDYAFLVDALTHLYEATFEVRWLRAALTLADAMVDLFWDAVGGGFFFTGRDHEHLIVRNKEPEDNAVPSGNSVAALGLLRLAQFTGRTDLADKATETLRTFAPRLAVMPMAYGQMLAAVDFSQGPTRSWVIVGRPGAADTEEVVRLLRGRFEPRRIMVALDPDVAVPAELATLAEGRTMQEGVATVYPCEGQTCAAPLVGPAALRQYLGQAPAE